MQYYPTRQSRARDLADIVSRDWQALLAACGQAQCRPMLAVAYRGAIRQERGHRSWCDGTGRGYPRRRYLASVETMAQQLILLWLSQWQAGRRHAGTADGQAQTYALAYAIESAGVRLPPIDSSGYSYSDIAGDGR